METADEQNVFQAISRSDVLLHHPYDSFSTSVQAFVAQAATDPKVLAIKQTLYRTSGDSPIVDALIEAARNGKQVLALVEIKARFDEQRNISWARKLEQAGVHVVYGLVGLKTHCKLLLVVRQEDDGLHRYCHIGTGNYHPRTARLYEDYGLLTKDPDVGSDLTKLFNQLSGYAPKAKFRRLLVAPTSVRAGLIDLIDAEADRAREGKEAWVKFKVNSVVDEKTIDALYRASQAGVQVDLVVRGICAMRAGVPGLSENIRIRSVLGRFLEHSRLYAFHGEDEPVVYIGSADLMHRNLDRRIEALISISDPDQRELLIENIDLSMADDVAAWELDADGAWTAHRRSDGRPPARPAVAVHRAPAQAQDPTQVKVEPAEVVLAAGALVWRVRNGELQVLAVHRPRYDDWSWPKGKLDPGETLPACAVREVAEETRRSSNSANRCPRFATPSRAAR